MRLNHIWLVALLGVALLFSYTDGVVCPISTCDVNDPNLPIFWMNTSVMASVARGLSMTSYPRTPDGSAFVDAYGMLEIVTVQELNLTGASCDSKNYTPDMSTATGAVLRYLNFSELCCQLVGGWEIIEGTSANKTYTLFNITNPDWPNFFFLFEFSVVNESAVVTKPASIGTYDEPYNITYDTHAAKITMQVHNWPWMGQDPANLTTGGVASYLKFFFNGQGLLDGANGGNVTVLHNPQHVTYIAFGAQSEIVFDFLTIFTADGADYDEAGKVPTIGPIVLTGISELPVFPVTLQCCHNGDPVPHFDLMTYDPTLSALFSPDPTTSSGYKTPGQKAAQPLNPAAYAVPIGVVLVVIAAVIGVYLWRSRTPYKLAAHKPVERMTTAEPEHATISEPSPAIAVKRDSTWGDAKAGSRLTNVKTTSASMTGPPTSGWVTSTKLPSSQ